MNLEKWMTEYCRRMEAAFGKRICFIGLQGSRARHEAQKDSDIDVVCILDELRPEDITLYGETLDGIEHRDLVCGFLSGWDELMHWEASELFQFYHDTVPFRGTLDALLECIDDASVERAVCIGAGNIYHGCVHNMVHGKNELVLKELYKAAGFVLRADCFRKTGRYVQRSAELMQRLDGREREIMEIALCLRNGGKTDFAAMSDVLFLWAKSLLT